MDKNSLRRNLKTSLLALSESDIAEKSFKLRKNLSEFLEDQTPNKKDMVLGGFVPIQQEPIWYQDLDHGIRTAIVSIKSQVELSFHLVDLLSVHIEGLGLELPDSLTSKQVTPDIILIPGLGFTRDGERLGRGKGFYDRFLQSFSGLTIGVCFEEQIVNDVFSEDHDQKCNFVITDKNIFKGNK